MSPIPINVMANFGKVADQQAQLSAKPPGGGFEKVRDSAAVQPGHIPPAAVAHELSPTASGIPPPNRISAAPDLLKPKFTSTGDSLSLLKGRVMSPDKAGAGGPLRARLQQLEAQFTASSRNLRQIGAQADPMQLLKLQHEIYQIDEELELLSKAVEQTTSGVKSLLQTQL